MKDPITTDDLRKAFLEFFRSKGHTVVASDSLVPQNDPSLLFTGAGMNQFKEYFLGVKKDLRRAATSQKCLRTGDLDEVGRTPFHHSFFEMLGNFSFGDYFKKEAILWAWEFLTVTLRIPKDRLRVTVHEKDEEAYALWRDQVGLPDAWITKCGDKTNFWPANAPAQGPNGPCGPCSEIYFDQNPSQEGTPVDESGKYAEIWNLVFTQYDRQDGGALVPLKNKNIDTGMGLERLACVLQGKASNFEIDIFIPIQRAIFDSLGLDPLKVPKKPLYCIADHLRAAIFSIADGVVPSNEGRGYVIRKLIRRAVWQAYELLDPHGKAHLSKPFLSEAVPAVVEVMGSAYPELRETMANVRSVLCQEEERFLRTLKDGLSLLRGRLDALRKKNGKTLPAAIVFELYDTFGFPEELTRKISEQEGIVIDLEGFERLMGEQRLRSKEGSKISTAIFSSSGLDKIPPSVPVSVFLGYDTLEATATVVWHQGEGMKATVILDRTPFYAESGGQTGDQGVIEGRGFKLRVLDTKKLDRYWLHLTEVLEGSIADGALVRAFVDRELREGAMRNHTATHLLHAALRNTLGPSVRQLGSMVAPERFRFDYAFGRGLTAEELRKIEAQVNESILANHPVVKKVEKLEDAKREGALAFFGDKYGDQVRMVTIEGISKELCGGTHCDATGQIGSFLITAETSVASGVRRIEGVTGLGVLRHVGGMQELLSRLAAMLKVGTSDLEPRVAKLLESTKKQKAQMKAAAIGEGDARRLLAGALKTGNVCVLLHDMGEADVNELRGLSDLLRNIGDRLVYLVAATSEGKLNLVGGTSKDLSKSALDMKELFGRLSGPLGVSGGGRKDFIQGGGRDQGQFAAVSGSTQQVIIAYLKEKGF